MNCLQTPSILNCASVCINWKCESQIMRCWTSRLVVLRVIFINWLSDDVADKSLLIWVFMPWSLMTRGQWLTNLQTFAKSFTSRSTLLQATVVLKLGTKGLSPFPSLLRCGNRVHSICWTMPRLIVSRTMSITPSARSSNTPDDMIPCSTPYGNFFPPLSASSAISAK